VRGVFDTSVDSLVHGGSDQDSSLVGELILLLGIQATYDLDKVDTDKMAHSLIISQSSCLLNQAYDLRWMGKSRKRVELHNPKSHKYKQRRAKRDYKSAKTCGTRASTYTDLVPLFLMNHQR
jgi:hypothetical protein